MKVPKGGNFHWSGPTNSRLSVSDLYTKPARKPSPSDPHTATSHTLSPDTSQSNEFMQLWQTLYMSSVVTHLLPSGMLTSSMHNIDYP